MVRGVMPRRPTKTGRQEGAKRATGAAKRVLEAKKPAAPVGKSLKSPRPPSAVRSVEGYNPTSPERITEILKRLDQLYPDVTCALTHQDQWELLVATILSAQSTDVRVNMVTPGLFEKYPTVQDFAALKPEQLQPDIYSTGFFRNKSKSVVGAAQKVVADFGGNVPQTMDELLTLPGVARKTANVVLGSGFGIAAGVVVDTHVMRLSNRLDLTHHSDPKKIELELMAVIPKEKWIVFSHQLIWHGRRVCVARKPRCIECNLEKLCYAKDKTFSTHS